MTREQHLLLMALPLDALVPGRRKAVPDADTLIREHVEADMHYAAAKQADEWKLPPGTVIESATIGVGPHTREIRSPHAFAADVGEDCAA